MDSGAEVIVEMATHHACDDYDKVSDVVAETVTLQSFRIADFPH
jgi:hypothetical protein